MTAAVLVALLCVLVEGFFSGSEIAIMAADRLALREQAARGSKGAVLALRLREAPQALLSTTLLGTNLAVVISTTFVTLVFIGRYGTDVQWLVLVIMSPLVLVLGEIIPKSIYREHALAMATRVAYPLWGLRQAFRPLIWALTTLSSTLLQLLHLDPATHRVLVTREDLLVLLDGSAEAGSDIQPEEEEMIERIIELPEVTVREVMIPLVEVEALEDTTTVAEAARAVQEQGYSRYPIYHERVDDIRGMLHVFDLLHAQRPDRPVGEIMREALIVPETARVDELLHKLRTAGQNLAVVVDEYGGAQGIVALEDILEEIIGEIDDEYDQASEFVRQVGPRRYLVTARVELDRLNEQLGLKLPEGDYGTLGGYLLEKLHRFPEAGESLFADGARFMATRVSDRSILEVLVELPPPEETAAGTAEPAKGG